MSFAIRNERSAVPCYARAGSRSCDADLLLRGKLPPGGAADLPDNLLRRLLHRPGFLSHLRSFNGYDGPEILPTSTRPFCLIGADAGHIKVTRNPDYWKKGRPYLDGIEYTIIRNLSTAVLGFVAGKFDMTFSYSLTVPLFNDAQNQLPQAI